MENIKQVVKKIEDVFPAQKLEGSSLWDMRVMDDSLGNPDIADSTYEKMFGRKEILDDWHNVPTEDLALSANTSISVYGGVDSWKYYLPAMMRFALTAQETITGAWYSIEQVCNFLLFPNVKKGIDDIHHHNPVNEYFTVFGISKDQAKAILGFLEMVDQLKIYNHGEKINLIEWKDFVSTFK